MAGGSWVCKDLVACLVLGEAIMRALGQDSKHNREPLVLLESLPKFYRY